MRAALGLDRAEGGSEVTHPRKERSVAERIAETEARYRGTPARNTPGPLPGEAFIQSLPEGAIVELRTEHAPWPGTARAWFTVRRKA